MLRDDLRFEGAFAVAPHADLDGALLAFERVGNGGYTGSFDAVFPLPTDRPIFRYSVVAVVVDRACASSCEDFVLDARQSGRVAVLGTENTRGSIDYGNVRSTWLPGWRRLRVPTSRSRRLPAERLNEVGIAPAVRIPEGADAVEFARYHLRAAAPLQHWSEQACALDSQAKQKGPPRQILFGQLRRPRQVGLQHRLHVSAEGGVVSQDGDLEIEEERAVIEVGRPDPGVGVVDEDHLLVHEPVLVQVAPPAGPLHIRQKSVGHEPEHPRVGPARHEHADVDTAQGRRLERAQHHTVGDEVRGRNPDPPLGCLDGLRVEQAARLEPVGRAGGERERVLVLLARFQRPLEPLGHLALPVVPVADERELEALHDGSPHVKVRVAPGADLRIPPEVLVAHVEPADEPGAPVHDDDLAVVAKVEPEAAEPAALPAEPGDKDAGLAERPDVAAGQGVAAYLVVKQVYADAPRRGAEEPALEDAPDLVVTDDVELSEDVVFGCVDGGKDRLVCGRTVEEQAEAVSPHERHPGEAGKAPELRLRPHIASGLGREDPAGQPIVGRFEAGVDLGVEGAQHVNVVQNAAGIVTLESGDPESALAILEESVAVCRARGDRKALATALGHLGWTCMSIVRIDAARACSEEALALYRELGDRRGIATAFQNLALAAAAGGQLAEAEALLQQNLALRREIGERRGVAYALHLLSWVAIMGEAFLQAKVHSSEGLAAIREVGDRQLEAYLLMGTALADVGLGRIEAATGVLEAAAALFKAQGNTTHTCLALLLLGEVLLSRGDVARGTASLEEGQGHLAQAKRDVAFAHSAHQVRMLGRIAHDRGDYIRAKAYYLESRALSETLGDRRSVANGLLYIGAADAGAGDPEAARQAFSEALAMLDALGQPLTQQQQSRFGTMLAALSREA